MPATPKKTPAARKTASKPTAAAQGATKIEAQTSVKAKQKPIGATPAKNAKKTVSSKTESKEQPQTSSILHKSRIEMTEYMIPLFPESARDMAEKSILSTREAFEKGKSALEEQNAALEKSIVSASEHGKALNEKLQAASNANIEAGFAFFSELLSTKNLSDAIELQTSFARKQFEALAEQSQDIQDAVSKGINDMSAPVKEAVQKVMEQSK